MKMTVEYILEVGDTVEDKSESIRFSVLCQTCSGGDTHTIRSWGSNDKCF